MSEPVTPAEVENSVATTSGDEDHENPDDFRGEEAGPPVMPTVEEYTAANGGVPPVEFSHFRVGSPDGGVE